MQSWLQQQVTGSEKKIYSANDSILMYTDIANLEVPPNEAGNVRYRQYILFDGNGNKCAVANPDYAEGDDPTVVGWPLCRMPRVDHAKVGITVLRYPADVFSACFLYLFRLFYQRYCLLSIKS